MKKNITLFISLLFISYSLHSAFKEIGWGARPTGMGNTFVAIADDANAPLYNPAGIARFKRQEITFTFVKPYLGLENIDLSLLYLSYAHPTDKFGSLGIFITDFAGAGLYRENIIALTYAYTFLSKISTGLNIKFLTHSYNWDDYIKNRAKEVNDPVIIKEVKDQEVIYRNRGSALTIDLGVLYSLRKDIVLGFSGKNLIPANVGIKYVDIVPPELKAGAAYLIPYWRGMDSIVCGIDISYRFQDWGETSHKFNINVGAETWFFVHTLGIRTGFNMNEFTLGASFNKFINPRLSFRIDYTFVWPLRLGDNLGTHRISLSSRFAELPIKLPIITP